MRRDRFVVSPRVKPPTLAHGPSDPQHDHVASHLVEAEKEKHVDRCHEKCLVRHIRHLFLLPMVCLQWEAVGRDPVRVTFATYRVRWLRSVRNPTTQL